MENGRILTMNRREAEMNEILTVIGRRDKHENGKDRKSID